MWGEVETHAGDWRERQVLLGECKWGEGAVPRNVVVELVEEKAPRLLRELADQGEGWQVHFALFARGAFTEAAKREAGKVGAILKTVKEVEEDLNR